MRELALKILKRPEKEETSAPAREDKPGKKVFSKKDGSEPLEINLDTKSTGDKPVKRKLKQIDISAIAERINKGKKDGKKNTVDKSSFK